MPKYIWKHVDKEEHRNKTYYLHRLDGPAVCWNNGNEEYYVDGVRCSSKEHWENEKKKYFEFCAKRNIKIDSNEEIIIKDMTKSAPDYNSAILALENKMKNPLGSPAPIGFLKEESKPKLPIKLVKIRKST